MVLVFPTIFAHRFEPAPIGSSERSSQTHPALPRSFADPPPPRLLDTTDTPAALRWCTSNIFGETGHEFGTKPKGAQEFLAAQFTEAGSIEEERLNAQAAFALAPKSMEARCRDLHGECEAETK